MSPASRHPVYVDRAAVDSFVRLQVALLEALADDLSVPVGSILNALLQHPAQSGHLEDAASARWRWRRHGLGVSFASDQAQVVDAHRRPSDPTVVDAWRLLQFVDRERKLHERDIARDLGALAAAGELVEVTFPGTHGGPLFRLASMHPARGWPLYVTGATHGGFIELQPGPFDNTHWHADSLFIDLVAAQVVHAPFEAALGEFDHFEFYEDLSQEQLLALAHHLREHAITLRSAPPPTWVNAHVPGSVGGPDSSSAERLVLAADLCDSLADWLESQRAPLSILGV